MTSTVTVRVSVETWVRLTSLKNTPSQSYDDIVVMLMNSYEELKEALQNE